MPQDACCATLFRVMDGRSTALFRMVNERIRELGLPHSLEYALVCECDDVGCARAFQMRPEEYEPVRSDPMLFAVLPGHEQVGRDVVLARTDRYVIVRTRERLH
jgi:hypothetical protein